MLHKIFVLVNCSTEAKIFTQLLTFQDVLEIRNFSTLEMWSTKAILNVDNLSNKSPILKEKVNAMLVIVVSDPDGENMWEMGIEGK